MTSNKYTRIPTTEEMKHAYLVERTPMNELAERWNIVPDYVRKLLRKAGVQPRDSHGLPGLTKSRTRIKDFTGPTPDQHQIILGSLLGDGALSNPTRKGEGSFTHSALKVVHSIKQLNYLEWMQSALSDIACPIYHRTAVDGIRVSFQTHSHPYFTSLRDLWYPSNLKIFNLSEAQTMNELGLAVWYMDDGTQGVSKGSPYGFFCTDGFTEPEQYEIQSFLTSHFGLSTSVVTNGNGRLRVRIKADGMRKLCDIIRPYVIPSMSYKLNC